MQQQQQMNDYMSTFGYQQQQRECIFIYLNLLKILLIAEQQQQYNYQNYAQSSNKQNNNNKSYESIFRSVTGETHARIELDKCDGVDVIISIAKQTALFCEVCLHF
jgi:hypothetical protein